MVCAEVKISKIFLLGLAENAFLKSFLQISLPSFLLSGYLFLCFLTLSKIALVLKGQEILIQNFLVRLGENLEFYLLLIGLFFLDRRDKEIQF